MLIDWTLLPDEVLALIYRHYRTTRRRRRVEYFQRTMSKFALDHLKRANEGAIDHDTMEQWLVNILDDDNVDCMLFVTPDLNGDSYILDDRVDNDMIYLCVDDWEALANYFDKFPEMFHKYINQCFADEHDHELDTPDEGILLVTAC